MQTYHDIEIRNIVRASQSPITTYRRSTIHFNMVAVVAEVTFPFTTQLLNDSAQMKSRFSHF